MARDFLNTGILGGGAGVSDGPGFRAIPTSKIDSPPYEPRFFETFPTVWASGYAFRKSLERGATATARDRRAVEEWVCLFLLHYFGILHLQEFDKRTLDTEYDKDIWPAFRGTFPNIQGEEVFGSIGILTADDGTVVGGFYPQVIFFPSRGRAQWKTSESIGNYLEDGYFSWKKCAVLLEDENDKERFHIHLMSVATLLRIRELTTNLEEFCKEKLGDLRKGIIELKPHPRDWDTVGRQEVDPEVLLQKYPLQKPRQGGGRTFFLLSDMDGALQPPWAKNPPETGVPAPINYYEYSAKEIRVKLAGKEYSCMLKEQDRIVSLSSLFLSDAPFWTKVPKANDGFQSRYLFKHEETILQDKSMREGDRAICLAPVKSEFFKYFPEVLNDSEAWGLKADPSGSLIWNFTVSGRQVFVESKPKQSADLANSSVSMYPPEVSRDWKLYAAHGTGSRNLGRWKLIDEAGRAGEIVELEEDEYVSLLHPFQNGESNSLPEGHSNRPRALCFQDAGGKERGILFLSKFTNQDADPDKRATMAVDFGTSNTSVAINVGESSVMKFGLSPVQLWGESPSLESPGFVPRAWGGSKGYFPTILLARKNDESLKSTSPDKLKIEHLFKVDVPSLHKDMSNRLLTGMLRDAWDVKDDLKWGADLRTPWRSLFLQMILLYTHAEVFFKHNAKVEKYVFTYPLAFSDEYGDSYHDKAQEAIAMIRKYCYGDAKDDVASRYRKVDESTAVATAIGEDGLPNSMDVFVDIGGGTADVAIRHDNRFLVLDSLRVAGRNFFKVTKKVIDDSSLRGSLSFRAHMEKLLGTSLDSVKASLPLGSLYSILINELDEKAFREREEAILKATMGEVSYKRYRARMFFNHLLAYSLIQAAAASVTNKVMLHNGLKIILGGNGWGLLLFAEWKRSSKLLRSEAEHILGLIKNGLRQHVTEEQLPYLEKLHVGAVQLLNETDLSRAKTSVAVGALKAAEINHEMEDTEPYTGITLKGVSVNGLDKHDIAWNDRWGLSLLSNRFGKIEMIRSVSVEFPDELTEPVDDILGIFTGLGNTARVGKDNLPPEIWQRINGKIQMGISSMKMSGGKLVVSTDPDDNDKPSAVPLNYFLSEILYPKDIDVDLLDDLAKVNESF